MREEPPCLLCRLLRFIFFGFWSVFD